MPIFEYTAKNSHYEVIKGKVEAKTKSQAVTLLSARGLFVIKLRTLNDNSFEWFKQFFNKVAFDDVVNFTRQMATMINAGLSLSKSLTILEQQHNPEMAKVVAGLLKEVETGGTFSNALAKHPQIFSRVYVQLVKAGEVGGVLDEVLERLAVTMEKEKEFRAKTKGALIYPAIVVTAMLIVATIMMVFVVPKLTDMYKDFGAQLPLPTLILMGISGFMVKNFILIVLGVTGGIFFFKNWAKTEMGQRKLDGWLFKLPIFGDLRKKIILTDFARTLSLLLGTGVSLLEALDIVAAAMDSLLYREALKDATKQVERGDSLSAAVAKYDLFPPLLNQMISVGEETGKIDDVLSKLSVFYESESEQAVKNMTVAMEPMIMIVLGIGVGMLVIAVILPIYSLTSQF
ncbi:MAG TPA: pilus assembly protein PilC [Candidatus Pacebacteria bacterium]|nr:pilus assembly protein PilC [Candidatus Paceibacterota bacterium]